MPTNNDLEYTTAEALNSNLEDEAASADVELANGDWEELEVATDNGANFITVSVSGASFDPSSPAEPPSYDLLVVADISLDETADERPLLYETGKTSFSETLQAVPESMKVRITNASGSTDTYNVSVKSHR